MDAHRSEAPAGKPTIVFNHSFIASRNPRTFFAVIEEMLDEHDARVLECDGFDIFSRILRKHLDRVTFSGTMPLDTYYRALWEADIQVSTAEHETLGISMLEAMYTNNACLVPNRTSYPEVVGEEAVLYSDQDDLRDRLAYFLRHPVDRRVGAKLAERSRR